jgi:hypothetical protein
MAKRKRCRAPAGNSLLEELRKRGIVPVKTIRVRFNNDDAPKFLKNLKRFQKASKKAGDKIIVH